MELTQECAHSAFERQALRNAVAVACDETRMSYGALESAANRLARRLRAQGDWFAVSPASRALQFASFSLDTCVFEQSMAFKVLPHTQVKRRAVGRWMFNACGPTGTSILDPAFDNAIRDMPDAA